MLFFIVDLFFRIIFSYPILVFFLSFLYYFFIPCIFFSATLCFYCIIVCRMKRYSTALELAKENVMSRSQAARRALLDCGSAAPSPQTARSRHASLPAGPTASTWERPLVPVCAPACETSSSRHDDVSIC